jgi:hypothetical protein
MKYILIKYKNIIYKIVNDLRPNMHGLLDPRLILHGLLDFRIVGVIEKPLLNSKFELMNLTFF